MAAGDGSRLKEREQEQARQQAAARRQQTQASALRNQFMQQYKPQVAELDTFIENTPDFIAQQRDTALQQQIAQRNLMAEQAQRVRSQPVGAPNVVPDMAPLQDITGVSLNPALTGGNAATQSFYLSPESTQSQFAVGAPVGGGGIGQRQKGTTDAITSRTDSLGARRKDEL